MTFTVNGQYYAALCCAIAERMTGDRYEADKYTSQGWKPIMLSSCAVTGSVRTVVNVTILFEK